MRILCRATNIRPARGYDPGAVEFEEVDDPEATLRDHDPPRFAPEVGALFWIEDMNG